MAYLFLESFSDNHASYSDHRKWDLSEATEPISYDMTGGRDGGPCYKWAPGSRWKLRKSIPISTNYINIGFALKLGTWHRPAFNFMTVLSRFFFKNTENNSLAVHDYSMALGSHLSTHKDFAGYLYSNLASLMVFATTGNDFWEFEEWNHYRIEFDCGVQIIYKNNIPYYRKLISGWAHKNCNLAAQGSVYMGDVNANEWTFQCATIQYVTFDMPFYSKLDDVYITTDPNLTEDLIVKRLNVDETVISAWSGNQPGNQHELLNEISCDSDSTHIYTPTKNAIATFKFEDLVLEPGQYVRGYQYVCHARRDLDAGGADLIITDNTPYGNLAVNDLSPQYQAISGGITGAFTEADINGLEMTVKVV